jgi:Flp pilus assembly protein TadG
MRATRCMAPRRARACMVVRQPSQETGAVAILFLVLFPVVMGFCGLALELSQVYNRKIEMRTVADTVALAAAFELDGTAAGIQKAVTKASERFTASPPSRLTYQYGSKSMDWSDSAIEFGTSSKGPWISAGSAAGKSSPNGLLYVRIDTGKLDTSYGEVYTTFMRYLSDDLATVSTGASAVAGRSGIAVTPLGICAMRPEASRNRNGELEEYGFRRGISYDLMQLNPDATTGGQSFLINPFLGPGATGTSASDTTTIAPFVCTGTMAVARVKGGAISVSAPFPLGNLYQHLNSRFDSYTAAISPCSPDSAPPDSNIKAYTFNATGAVTWMSPAPGRQEAAPSTVNGKLWTVAGPDPTPSGTTAGQYGVLWAYAQAVNYAATQPTGGYTPYATSSWSTLYSPGQPAAASTYPSLPPYFKASYTKSPNRTGVPSRRVLNVALLSCPVSGSSANVAGIGRFFMTVPADSTHLYAEFAGLAQEQNLRNQVRLYQ